MLIYREVFDKLTGTWVEDPVQTDPSLVETVVHTREQKLAMGAYKGMKGKSFSEMTPEEQKLFVNDNGKEGKESNQEESKES